jgi:hypothetical protein
MIRGGITIRDLKGDSRLSQIREEHSSVSLLSTVAASYTLCAQVDLAAANASDGITLAGLGAGYFPSPCKIKLVQVDASGSTLATTVTLVGERFGKRYSENVALAGGQTVESAGVFDRLISATIAAIANKAASDTLNIYTSASAVGLRHPIQKLSDVKAVFYYDVANSTLVRVSPLSSTNIDLKYSAIKNLAAAAGSAGADLVAADKGTLVVEYAPSDHARVKPFNP